MDVPMELSRVVISELGDQQVVFLREINGSRSFPILIGLAEAVAIDRRLNAKPTPRPMTHDLLANAIEAMDGTLDRIVINDIRDHTFIATLHIRQGGRVVEVDSRPSDAIALGVGFNTPLFVAEHVLNNVLAEPTVEDRIELLRNRMDMLAERISQITDQLEDEDFLAEASESVVQQYRQQLEEMKQEYDAIDRVLRKLK